MLGTGMYRIMTASALVAKLCGGSSKAIGSLNTKTAHDGGERGGEE